jgi:MFS family permease
MKKKKNLNYYNNKNNNNNNFKGIISLIGCLLHSFINSLFYSFNYLIIYLLSYLKSLNNNNNNKIHIQNYYIFSPLSTLFYGIFSPISGILNYKIGISKTLLLSNIIMIITSIIIFFSENILMDYLMFIFYGIGIGLSQRISIHNCVKYFPNKKGLISSLFSTFCGIGIIILNFYVENFIINPQHLNPTIENNTFYSKEINDNFKLYLKFQIYSYLILTILCFFLIVPFEENDNNNNNDNEEKLIEINNNNNDDDVNYIQMEKEEKEENYNINEIKLAYKSNRFLKLLFIFLTTNFFLSLIENSFRPIAIFKKIDTKTQQNIISIIFILICILTIIFGILSDKFSFKILMNIINIIILFSCFFYNFCGISNIIFIFWCLSISFGNSGLYSIFYPHLMKIFGVKYYLELSGIFNLIDSFCSPFVSIFIYFMEIFFEKNRNFCYFIVYFFCGILEIFNVFITCRESECEFEYKK